MDRILRPGGKIIVRDEPATVREVEETLKSLHWNIRLTFTQGNEGILSAEKTDWRPQAYSSSSWWDDYRDNNRREQDIWSHSLSTQSTRQQNKQALPQFWTNLLQASYFGNAVNSFDAVPRNRQVSNRLILFVFVSTCIVIIVSVFICY